MSTATKAVMSLQDVAAQTPWSVDTIRRAVRATDPDSFPPPLKAKRGPKGSYVIREQDFREWIDGLPDA
ncbi:hypothetical protein H9L10_03705 [Phycicoccus endophyticus]|uniref:Helix-turn-helix domain-containing protein n=1 Tax=Phycicoccus endophyticus TaxID=1690220 RepID=A0A7G9R3J9_9MICO|nr:hypothetical protein [Phycicoccus endophyticus]NHI19931.1 hypothetical protein [Phycicoccus endophyticus]QNN50174.1 hypothetical protein H9L10_03705 [Phycicoccus endophyticus]GGL27443.1 hypothetical protein GCM10012283_07020 [Phycicoccus endophyticus]